MSSSPGQGKKKNTPMRHIWDAPTQTRIAGCPPSSIKLVGDAQGEKVCKQQPTESPWQSWSCSGAVQQRAIPPQFWEREPPRAPNHHVPKAGTFP